MSVKLISKNERYPSNPEKDKKPKDPIELPYVTAYDVTVSTPKTSLAKTYEVKNEIKITLEIPKSDYKNESFQKLIKWAELPVQDENYYRDIAVNLTMAGDNERTVLFTHGRITLDIHNTTKADFVTVKVFVKQKEDQYIGVVFGQELGETYKEARQKVENPSTLNIFIPLVMKSVNENREYSARSKNVYEASFRTNGKYDFTVETSADGKTFKSADGKRTESIDYVYSRGYRYVTTHIDPGVTVLTEYARTSIDIYVKNIEKSGSYPGYISIEKKYCSEPVDLFEKLGYKCEDKGSYYRIKHSMLNLETLSIPKVKYDGYTLNNVDLSDIQTQVSKQISSKVIWDGATREATFDLSTTEGEGKKYITLEQMKNLGWGKIHSGYKVASTGVNSPIDDMTSEISREHRDINQKDIDKINALFEKYQINTKKRISAFFAECSAETSNGNRFVEGAGTGEHPFVGSVTRTNINKWFDDYTKYGSKYRGGGAIQLTWEHHYVGFEEWMGKEFGIDDSDIVDKGAEYVAMNYTWEAAVFFWSKSALNSKADSGDIHQVTAVVNSKMSSEEYALRESAYNNWMKKYIFPY